MGTSAAASATASGSTNTPRMRTCSASTRADVSSDRCAVLRVLNGVADAIPLGQAKSFRPSPRHDMPQWAEGQLKAQGRPRNQALPSSGKPNSSPFPPGKAALRMATRQGPWGTDDFLHQQHHPEWMLRVVPASQHLLRAAEGGSATAQSGMSVTSHGGRTMVVTSLARGMRRPSQRPKLGSMIPERSCPWFACAHSG